MERQRFAKSAFFNNNVVIPMKDFIQEHTKLLNVLDKKDPKQLNAERKEQSAELDQKLKSIKKARRME